MPTRRAVAKALCAVVDSLATTLCVRVAASCFLVNDRKVELKRKNLRALLTRHSAFWVLALLFCFGIVLPHRQTSALAQGKAETPTATPVVLRPYSNRAEQFTVVLPRGWTRQEAGDKVFFISPDGSAQFLFHAISDFEQATSLPALLKMYEESGELGVDITVSHSIVLRLIGGLAAFQRTLDAGIFGVPVEVSLAAFQRAGQRYVIVAIVQADQADASKVWIDAAFEYFELAPLPTPTPTATVSPTPTVTSIPTSTHTPTPAPTATLTSVPTDTPTTRPTATPRPGLSAEVVRGILIGELNSSSVSLSYPGAAERFASSIADQVSLFDLSNIGSTQITQYLAFLHAGDRTRALVQNVWSDRAAESGDLAYTRGPGAEQTPFRALVIRLIQGSQGRLTTSQFQAIINFYSRTENPSVWYGNIDTIIEAVNRESFDE